MVTLQQFSTFMGLGQKSAPSVKSYGLLVITKGPTLLNRPLIIPKGTLFDTSETAQRFETVEANTISESASFLPVGVRARAGGERGNIPANQTWSSPQIGSVTATNPQAFSGGINSKPEVPGYFPQRGAGKGPSPAQMQIALDTGHAMVESVLRLDPDTTFESQIDARVTSAILISSLWFLENNTVQTLETVRPSLHSVAPTERRIFKDRLYKPIMAIVTNLCSHKINWQRRLRIEKTA